MTNAKYLQVLCIFFMTGLLIFDLDNTLVHSRIDFAAIRRDITALWRRQQVTTLGDEQLQRLSIGQIIELSTDAALTQQAWQIVLEQERAGMQLATIEDGAAPVLQVLAARDWRLAILTNNARAATLDALEKFALKTYFSLILTRDEVPMKPDAGGIRHACKYFEGVCHALSRRTIMIGDSWLDGAAAKQAGVPFLAFAPRPEAFIRHQIPVWRTAQKLEELPALLDEK